MQKPNLSLTLLFVSDPIASSAFYSRLFDQEPIEVSPTFSLFIFPNGMQLGFWSPKTAEPPAKVNPGGCEIAFNEKNVDQRFDQWLALGVPILQPPTNMDFGRTFVAKDPDGHRIRVYRVWEDGKK